MSKYAKKLVINTHEKALAAFLGCNVDDVSEMSYKQYGAPSFEAEGKEYIVATDDEANDAVTEYIKDSVWAFNASFLASMTDVPEEAFSSLKDQCESGNDWVLRLIEKTCGLSDFVDAAVSADGRGHFLSSYDGNENESGEYFIYRTN